MPTGVYERSELHKQKKNLGRECWVENNICRIPQYHAQIKFNHKVMSIGFYFNAEEAARAYDKKAAELFGEYAFLNFPEVVL